MNKTSIILLTYNSLACTENCLQSIRAHTSADDIELIVVDNSSTDGTVAWLKAQSGLRLIENSENKGFSGGCNRGIRAAEQGNDILLLNNDTIVAPNWLQNLQACLYSAPDIGAVGPVTNCCSNGQQIAYSGTTQDIADFAKAYNTAAPLYERKLRLVGFCMLIRREVVDQIGLLDERFFPGNYEDDDYSFRIGQAGYRLLLSRNTFIYHRGSTTFGPNSTAFSEAMAVNAKRFADKWGFSADYSNFVRTDLIGMMEDPPETPLNVLEVGCACGGTLLKLEQQYPKAHLFGVELNAQAAAIAGQVAQVETVDIEQRPFPFGDQLFDYILFPDVLEHLHNPGSVLQEARKRLLPGGRVLASIPNIMYYKVVDALLHGRFTYADAGILDRAHLRFFTMLEIQHMFIRAGYSLELTLYKYLPIDGAGRQVIDRLAHAVGDDAELRAQFGAYQYLVRAHAV